MLTLLETISAIKALDTEPDIIKGACRAVLKIDKLKELPPELLAKQIILDYFKEVDTSKLIIALCMSLGQLAGMACKPDKEEELIANLANGIRSEMYSFQAFEKRMKSILPPELVRAMAKAMGESRE